MTKIVFNDVLMTSEQIEAERVRYSKLFDDDLSIWLDSSINGFMLLSDEELHIKPILQDQEVKDALEIVRLAKESHCNTTHDKMVFRRY